MKMYYFSKGGYYCEYHVMEESKEMALESLREYLEDQDRYYSDGEHISSYGKGMYKFFKNNPNRIFEFERGQVVETEVS
jgi:hypothetical protein